jgi:hypothetical protein
MFYLLSISFYIAIVSSIDVHYVNTIESSNSGFGKSVDMYNNTLVVGTVGRYSNTGNYATIYQKIENTWDVTNYIELAQNGWFGYDVSLNNMYCAVGGYAADKVYIYKKNDENVYTSQLQQTLKQTNSHEYGKSVSLSDNYMIVGAPNNNAYIYQLQDDTYTLVRSITEYTSESSFGISVDITDEYAVVGSNTKAFLFINNDNTWNNGIIIDGYTDQTNFGYKVALTNDYLAVSAYGARKVFIFDKNNNGSWNKDAFVVIDQYTSESEFGYSLSIYNQMLLVGARGANSAYLFENIQNVSYVVIMDDFNDQVGFGSDVVLSDTDMAITSFTQSKVYLFSIAYEPPTSSPTPISTSTPTSSPSQTPTSSPTPISTSTPTSSPSQTPTSSPSQTPTSSPSQTPTSSPSQTPTSSPSQTPTLLTYVFSSTPTSFPTINRPIQHLTKDNEITGYVVIMCISITLLITVILSIFYIVHKYKKYNTVHVEDELSEPDNFTSINTTEHEGWNKTVHPIHSQYDSDEESQIIAPIHEKYKLTALLPV